MVNILVVDDHPLSRKFMRTVLCHAGYTVLEARDGQHALQIAHDEQPQLVITDLHMPEMDGGEFARRVRLEPVTTGIPIVFYTATYREEEARALARSYGVSHVIAKPAPPDRILQVVREVLDAQGIPSMARRVHVTTPRARRMEPESKLALRLTALLELGIDLMEERQPEEVLRFFCRALISLMSCQYVCCGVLRTNGKVLSHFCTSGYDAIPEMRAGRSLPTLDGFGALQALPHMEPMSNEALCADLFGLPANVPTPPFLLAMPMRRGQSLMGWVAVGAAQEFHEDDERLLATLWIQAAIAFENSVLQASVRRRASVLEQEVRTHARLGRKLARQASYDALTDLPNPVLLADRLQQALAYAHRYDEQVALAYIDLDGFKQINDTLGHAAGDMLLKEVAARLRKHTRQSDTVARKGGDEFIAVLTGVTAPTEAEAAVRHILEAIHEPVRIGAHECRVSASIGISVFPVDGNDAQTLLSHADLAMYDAKRRGRNCVRFYHEELEFQTNIFAGQTDLSS